MVIVYKKLLGYTNGFNKMWVFVGSGFLLSALTFPLQAGGYLSVFLVYFPVLIINFAKKLSVFTPCSLFLHPYCDKGGDKVRNN
jgi:hypothetical protein